MTKEEAISKIKNGFYLEVEVDEAFIGFEGFYIEGYVMEVMDIEEDEVTFYLFDQFKDNVLKICDNEGNLIWEEK